ncbi:hypothetical protein CPB85DRAFT_1452173 [Mucidula mucida]|nr:hypothetical protein CPB85DRAFT_1452173 [Mucidula mucida]
MSPSFELDILVLPKEPTQSNAANLTMIFIIVKVSGPPAKCCKNVRAAVKAQFKNHVPLLYRVTHWANVSIKDHQVTVRKDRWPSVAAESHNYFRMQASADALLDRRFTSLGPSTAAPPIELFHPAFASYKRDSEDLSWTSLQMSFATSQRFCESSPPSPTMSILATTDLEELANSNRTSVSLTRTPIDSSCGTPVFLQLKIELDSDEPEPSLQLSFSYAQYHCAREPVQMPCVRHACSRIGGDTSVFAVARRFFALRRAIAELAAYYKTIHPSTTPDRYFPSFKSYTDENGNSVAFRYVKPLEMDLSCMIFLAKRLDSEEQFVVKFAYGFGGFTPQLLCHQLLDSGYDGWVLVAMDYVAGQKDLPMRGRIRIIDIDWVCVEGGGARWLFREIRALADAEEYDIDIRRAVAAAAGSSRTSMGAPVSFQPIQASHQGKCFELINGLEPGELGKFYDLGVCDLRVEYHSAVTNDWSTVVD